jgi:hypothetical protein
MAGSNPPHRGTLAPRPGARLMLTAEDRLLLLLARPVLTSAETEEVCSLVERPLDWLTVLALARSHEVYPLLYRQIRTLGVDGVPDDVSVELERLYKVNALRNWLLARELRRVLSLLADREIPAIPLKGCRLARWLYGDVAARVSVDIDILVRREDTRRALQVLYDCGYRSEFRERFFRELLLRSDIEYALVRRYRVFEYLLELHWGLLRGSRREAARDFWAEARQGFWDGAPMHIPSLEWEFLYLCGHAARHHWRGLKWLVDIHELSRSWPLNWAAVEEKARRLGWTGLVQTTLRVCSDLFGTAAPANLTHASFPVWLTPNPLASVAGDAITEALIDADLWQAGLTKIRRLLAVLFVPTLAERRMLRLPVFAVWLYFLMRPVRLAWRWSWWLLTRGRVT